jgi:predicted Fe-Mo cluster-binding NifX family protein
MERIAIPVFQTRISPVLDACNRLLVVDIDNGKEIQRADVSLEKMSRGERTETISRWNVDTIICAGVSELMCSYIAGRGVHLICGIAGELEKIIDAYIHNRLDQECFLMPGKKGPHLQDST